MMKLISGIIQRFSGKRVNGGVTNASSNGCAGLEYSFFCIHSHQRIPAIQRQHYSSLRYHSFVLMSPYILFSPNLDWYAWSHV